MVNSRVMVGIGSAARAARRAHHATTRLEHILNKINLGGVEQGVFNPRPAPVTTATTAARHAAHPGACSTPRPACSWRLTDAGQPVARRQERHLEQDRVTST